MKSKEFLQPLTFYNTLYRKEQRSHFHRRAISVQTQFQPTLSSLSKTCLTAFSKETEATLSTKRKFH